MAQPIRALAALVEDWGLVFNTHVTAKKSVSSIPKDPTSYSGLHGHCMDMELKYPCKKTPLHIKINKSF